MARLWHALALLAVAACGPDPAPASTPDEARTVNPAPGLDASTAPAPLPTDDPSAQGAVNVVLDYYGAIAERDYRRAYEWWGPSGPSSQSFDGFAAGFDDTAEVRAVVEAPSDLEGAAGSVFVTVPVIITTRTASGAGQRFEGPYTLRRVNDVGVNDVERADPWQLRWHIASADLREIP